MEIKAIPKPSQLEKVNVEKIPERSQSTEDQMKTVLDVCKNVLHVISLESIINNLTHNYSILKELNVATKQVIEMVMRNLEESDAFLI